MNQQCHRCHQLIPAGAAIMSGAGVDRRATCPTCYLVHRAVKHVDAAAVEADVCGGTLSERMERAGLL